VKECRRRAAGIVQTTTNEKSRGTDARYAPAWTTPMPCMKSSADATCLRSLLASASEYAPCLIKCSNISPPSSRSNTSK